MRALLALALVPWLAACDSPPPPKAPRQPAPESEAAQLQRRRAAAAQEREEQEHAEQDARAQALEARLQKEGDVYHLPTPPAPSTPAARYVPPAGKAEGDDIMRRILQDSGAAPTPAPAPSPFWAWIARDLSAHSSQAAAVGRVWFAYAQMARDQRTLRALVDAMKESETLARASASHQAENRQQATSRRVS